MMKKILFLTLSLLTLVSFSKAFAVSIPTLYQGEAPVASHSAGDWQKGAGAAFEQVLIKVSGNPMVGQIASVRKAINKSDNFVQSYNYASLDLGNGRSVMSMQVRFSPKAVNDLLQQAGQPILPRDRPLTLVLLAIQNTSDAPPMIVGDSSNPVTGSIQKEASKLALPLFWPGANLNNSSAITPAQVWGLNQTAAQTASKRYQTDAVLLGKLSPVGKNGWQGQWLLINNGANKTWQTQGSTPNAAAAAMVNQFARFIVPASLGSSVGPAATNPSASAPSSPGTQDVTLKVSGINGLGDYTALIDYLRSLDVVKDLSVLQTQGDQLAIRVKVYGPRNVLINAISTSNQLAPLVDNAAQVPTSLTTPPILLYQWQGIKNRGKGPNRSYMPPSVRSAPAPAPTSAPQQQNGYQQSSQYPPVIDQSGSGTEDGNPGTVETYPADNGSDYNSRSQVPYEVSP